jgi:hypothetical protein
MRDLDGRVFVLSETADASPCMFLPDVQKSLEREKERGI